MDPRDPGYVHKGASFRQSTGSFGHSTDPRHPHTGQQNVHSHRELEYGNEDYEAEEVEEVEDVEEDAEDEEESAEDEEHGSRDPQGSSYTHIQTQPHSTAYGQGASNALYQRGVDGYNVSRPGDRHGLYGQGLDIHNNHSDDEEDENEENDEEDEERGDEDEDDEEVGVEHHGNAFLENEDGVDTDGGNGLSDNHRHQNPSAHSQYNQHGYYNQQPKYPVYVDSGHQYIHGQNQYASQSGDQDYHNPSATSLTASIRPTIAQQYILQRSSTNQHVPSKSDAIYGAAQYSVHPQQFLSVDDGATDKLSSPNRGLSKNNTQRHQQRQSSDSRSQKQATDSRQPQQSPLESNFHDERSKKVKDQSSATPVPPLLKQTAPTNYSIPNSLLDQVGEAETDRFDGALPGIDEEKIIASLMEASSWPGEVERREFGSSRVKRVSTKPERLDIRFIHTKKLFSDRIRKEGFRIPYVVHRSNPSGLKVPANFSTQLLVDLAGADTPVPVYNYNTKVPTGSTWTLSKYMQYFLAKPEDRTKFGGLNVVGFDYSKTPLVEHLSPPKLISDLDVYEKYWPWKSELSAKKGTHNQPKRLKQKYLSVELADTYSDFQLESGGASVWCHVIRGEKWFLILPPNAENMESYKKWATGGSLKESKTPFRGTRAKYFRLKQGETLFLPGDWIHAVYTPVDTISFGGNFIHMYNLSTNVFCFELEKQLASKPIVPFIEELLFHSTGQMLLECQVGHRTLTSDELESMDLFIDYLLKCNDGKQSAEIDSKQMLLSRSKESVEKLQHLYLSILSSTSGIDPDTPRKNGDVNKFVGQVKPVITEKHGKVEKKRKHDSSDHESSDEAFSCASEGGDSSESSSAEHRRQTPISKRTQKIPLSKAEAASRNLGTPKTPTTKPAPAKMSSTSKHSNILSSDKQNVGSKDSSTPTPKEQGPKAKNEQATVSSKSVSKVIEQSPVQKKPIPSSVPSSKQTPSKTSGRDTALEMSTQMASKPLSGKPLKESTAHTQEKKQLKSDEKNIGTQKSLKGKSAKATPDEGAGDADQKTPMVVKIESKKTTPSTPTPTKKNTAHPRKEPRPVALIDGEIGSLALEKQETDVLYTPRFVVRSIGEIISDDENFFKGGYYYPVGFKAERIYRSMKSAGRETVYYMEVIHDKSENRPIFRAVPGDDPTNIVEGATTSFIWTQILKACSTADGLRPSASASGPVQYGFSHPTVKAAILAAAQKALPKSKSKREKDD